MVMQDYSGGEMKHVLGKWVMSTTKFYKLTLVMRSGGFVITTADSDTWGQRAAELVEATKRGARGSLKAQMGYLCRWGY
jgi:hypothetical protein